ncbi:MAG: hypothetical protein WHU10_07570 [Fimbriimonadales bacterium]
MRHLPKIVYEKVGPYHIRVVEARVVPKEGGEYSALAVVIDGPEGRFWPVHSVLTTRKEDDYEAQEALEWAFGIAVQALSSFPHCLDLLPASEEGEEVLPFLKSVLDAPLVGGLVVVDGRRFARVCRDAFRTAPPSSLTDFPNDLLEILMAQNDESLAGMGLARLDLREKDLPCASEQAELN